MIYIAIPAHNEERTIGLLVWKIRRVMAEFRRDYEVIVLDDGSTDATRQTVERYLRRLPLRLVTNDTRQGYAAAMEKLLREAVDRSGYPKRDMVVTLQGDFTEDPSGIIDMVKRIEGGADLVGGTPVAKKGEHPFSLRFARGAARFLLGRTARRAPISDPFSGFRAYRVVVLKKALREVPEGKPFLTGDAWGTNLDLLLKTAPHARRIEEIPYSTKEFERPRGTRIDPLPYFKSTLPFRGAKWPPPPPPPKSSTPPAGAPSGTATVP